MLPFQLMGQNKSYKQNTCSFVLSQSCLSPLKEQHSSTIPNLQLQAPILAVRLICTILEEIDFDIYEIRFWNDSRISLSFIRNSSKRFPVYIMNRLHEIKLNYNINQRCFILRKNNPADQCTC